MTQPDGYTPSGALTSTGLSAYAGKTQADWENEQKSLVTGRFSGAQTGFYSLVIGKIPIIGDVVEIFTGIEDGNRNDLGTLVNNVKSAIGSAWQGVIKGLTNTWNALWNGLTGNTTGTGKSHVNVQTAAAAVTSKANDAYTNADTADVKAQGAIDGINQAVTGATGTGATAGTVATNMTALKATPTNLLNSLISGYTVETINQNVSPKTWTKPAGITELFVVLFGAGANGSTGGTKSGTPFSSVSGGAGGQPGAVIALQIDPTTVPSSVTVTIGTPSSPTTSFGSIVSSTDAYAAYVATPLGLMPTAAAAGSGAAGGSYTSYPYGAQNGATAANTTAGATGGGGGGAATTGGNVTTVGGTGGAGGGGLNFGLCQTGGAGGGGGGAAGLIGNYTASVTGGKGGAGGFPSGGGGGGGAAYRDGVAGTATGGSGGSGGNGVALIIYKIAKTTA